MKVTLGQIRKIIREEIKTPRSARRRKTLNEVTVHQVDELDPEVEQLLDIMPDASVSLSDSDSWRAVIDWVQTGGARGLVLFADNDTDTLYCWFAKSVDDVLRRS